MDGVHLFTQAEKYVEYRRRHLFLTVGLLPLITVSFLMTWLTGRAGSYLGIGPTQVVLAIPLVLAGQFLLLATTVKRCVRAILRLTPEQLVIESGTAARRFRLDSLRQLTIHCDSGNAVVRVVLKFEKARVSLEGYLGMDTLRDMLVRYAGTDPKGVVRMRDAGLEKAR